MGLSVTGIINNQNLNPTSGTATVGSFLKLADRHSETYRSEIDRVSIQITGTYTGALTPQVSNNNETWVSVGPVAVENVGTGASTQTIPSGATGAFLVDTAGFKYFRLSANAPFSGGANATAHGTVADGGKVQYVKILDATADGEGKASVGIAGLKVDLGALLAGEDLTANRLLTEQANSYTAISTAATTAVKTGAGLLHRIVVTGGTTGTITVYDNTAGSGTQILNFDTTSALASYEINARFSVGLTIVTSAATKLTVIYR